MSTNITKEKLDLWIKHDLNVLMRGPAGVGKTATIIQAFERNNLKWRYFSGGTIDPWVDFVGIPKEVKDKNGNSYLDLVRPKCFANDEVEAIFMDEFNRLPKKGKNALMELIQFKSINGHKFNNLKIVWVAINPDQKDDLLQSQKYDVDPLDPAQLDRFHIHVNFDSELNAEYFSEKYDRETFETVAEWWHALSVDLKHLVSPRRVDYALDCFQKNIDLCDVLPAATNPSKLEKSLANGPIYKKVMDLFQQSNDDILKFFKDENNYTGALPYVLKDVKLLKRFGPLFPLEKQAILIDSKPIFGDIVSKFPGSYSGLLTSLEKTKPALVKKIRQNSTNTAAAAPATTKKPALKPDPAESKDVNAIAYGKKLDTLWQKSAKTEQMSPEDAVFNQNNTNEIG